MHSRQTQIAPWPHPILSFIIPLLHHLSISRASNNTKYAMVLNCGTRQKYEGKAVQGKGHNEWS